ncbi:MAG TPA: sulfatase-like hydrolase/transferase [Cyclobacteriaceae bacterium]|jgi:arylsulfatase A-like enzyme
MTKSIVFGLTICLVSFCLLHLQAQTNTSNRPNILWLSVEDMSPWLNCYGDSTVPTPNIDRLAREGIRYDQAFSTAGVCAPSRCAIITGMYQTSVGGHNMRTFNIYPEVQGVPRNYSIVPPPEVKAFPEYLRAEGYYCTNNSKTDYQFIAPPTVWDENSNTAHYKNRAPGQPFFAVFNCTITHESQVWMRSDRPLRVSPDKVTVPPFYPDTDSVRRDIARFYTNISEMDDWVGERLRELEESGEMDNTIIFFWSDHGSGLPYFKREITDRGLRSALIIRYSDKRQAGSVVTDLVSFVDLAPTVLSLAGIKPPHHMQGQAFAGKFQASRPRKYVFGARDRMDIPVDRVRSVRDANFRYVRNFNPHLPAYQDIPYRMQQPLMREIIRYRDSGRLNAVQQQWFNAPRPAEELFVLSDDPYELNNVADDPKYRKQLQQLRKVLDEWIKETNDLGRIPEPELLKRMWDGQDHPPVTVDPVIRSDGKTIRITCATEGASIGYQLIEPGETPSEKWAVYTGPFESRGKTVVAIAQRIGYLPSQTVTHSR